MTLVERIKQKCKEKNTSMNALEKEIGLGNGTIRLWDIKEPGSGKVIAVAEKLGCSLDWILTGKEAEDLTPEERKLVEYYRKASPEGKEAIRGLAEYQASKVLPEGVSASRIG